MSKKNSGYYSDQTTLKNKSEDEFVLPERRFTLGSQGYTSCYGPHSACFYSSQSRDSLTRNQQYYSGQHVKKPQQMQEGDYYSTKQRKRYW